MSFSPILLKLRFYLIHVVGKRFDFAEKRVVAF